ncbi:MAG: pantetheine-phosphate adenylyltransferase [Candidatus Thermoplasmatota archaeon]
MKVCIGGTFDIIHKGHRMLIETAFKEAGKDGYVFIGVTDGELAERKKTRYTFKERCRMVEDYLSMVNNGINYKTEGITDRYGPSINEDFDAIVVSSETKRVADEINDIRIKKGMKPLRIVTIPLVLAEDNKPISTSRIKKGEIDKEGGIIKRP